MYLNSTPVNYHSALSFWTSSKKDNQLSSFLIFLQNRDRSFFPLVSLKARHRHHYNRCVSSFRGIVWPRLEPLWYKNCEIAAVVPFEMVPVSQYFSHCVIMCRNDAFGTAYFNSSIEWMKSCPGILEKVAMLLEREAEFELVPSKAGENPVSVLCSPSLTAALTLFFIRFL